ncbi:uncharacterized protein LOC141904443 [Tubulanus polymorphus]|uniref:uncharacterized protein LOC141904443 n=1 Tax=Tubulanus polymorphus TaxID=672921 RepID=UPI003DA223EF
MTRPDIASPPRKANDRRIMKPLIEKKRRSRINSSLNELKTLLEVVIGKQIPRDYKLEKADILELTVSHLKSNISQLQRAMNPNDINKYQIGFSECVSEVSNYLMTIDGADPELRPRVLEHLSNRIGNVRNTHLQQQQQQQPQPRHHTVPFGYTVSSSHSTINPALVSRSYRSPPGGANYSSVFSASSPTSSGNFSGYRGLNNSPAAASFNNSHQMAQPSTSSGELRNMVTAIAAPLAMPAKRCPVEVIHQQAVTENVWRPW